MESVIPVQVTYFINIVLVVGFVYFLYVLSQLLFAIRKSVKLREKELAYLQNKDNTSENKEAKVKIMEVTKPDTSSSSNVTNISELEK